MIVMRISKARVLIISVVFAHGLVLAIPARGGFVPLMTQDATQPVPAPNPQDDFEEVLTGNKTSLFANPITQYRNAFSETTPPTVNYDATTNTTIVHFAGSTIGSDPSTFNTFGFAINAVTLAPGGETVDPGNKDGYWTPGTPAPPGLPDPVHVPTPDTMATYSSVSNEAVITISNDPGFTFSLSSVGSVVTNTPYDITSLNRTDLSPGMFNPSTVPNGTTLGPGGSTSYTISGISPGQYVTLFADAQFSGDSSDELYQGVSGTWLEFQAGGAVPEPASWVLMVIGTAALLGQVARRRGVRTSSPFSPLSTKTAE
jgi:hypothetical protein